MALLTVRETAAELRLGTTKTWQLCSRGELPVVRLGRRVLVTRHDLDAYIEAHREGGSDNGTATSSAPEASHGDHGRGRRAKV